MYLWPGVGLVFTHLLPLLRTNFSKELGEGEEKGEHFSAILHKFACSAWLAVLLCFLSVHVGVIWMMVIVIFHWPGARFQVVPQVLAGPFKIQLDLAADPWLVLFHAFLIVLPAVTVPSLCYHLELTQCKIHSLYLSPPGIQGGWSWLPLPWLSHACLSCPVMPRLHNSLLHGHKQGDRSSHLLAMQSSNQRMKDWSPLPSVIPVLTSESPEAPDWMSRGNSLKHFTPPSATSLL